ncbi:CIS tube protein [Bradyrhizobium niftali]|uniref:LysM domain-containing protein n=1 Tax=Bradyrhizobium niftali TaxID=2560055 RepID=A0A4Y9M3F5_9BRAD|nr:LysM peptidoglycan-binding domain-containing protein [Bradyrhizobium niftali]TFV49632.1 LysM domain-containing protein [Bradyrhizobium niftali]
MSDVAKATLLVHWALEQRDDRIELTYNPAELSFEKGVQLAEIAIPGLNAPLQQFVRGQAEKLNVELFFDTTEFGMAAGACSVTTETDRIYALTRIEPSGHAPPPVTFVWGKSVPGMNLPQGTGSQRREGFRGIVESVRHRFTLFSPAGVPLRAIVNLTIREFAPLHEQLARSNPSSPDRSHLHILKDREQLSAVASRYYLQPAYWREIAASNDIDDPRRLLPGRLLQVPALTDGSAS